MASKANIFENDQQEFEQGQIPSNNQGIGSLLLEGSINNQVKSTSTIIFNPKSPRIPPQTALLAKGLRNQSSFTSQQQEGGKKYLKNDQFRDYCNYGHPTKNEQSIHSQMNYAKISQNIATQQYHNATLFQNSHYGQNILNLNKIKTQENLKQLNELQNQKDKQDILNQPQNINNKNIKQQQNKYSFNASYQNYEEQKKELGKNNLNGAEWGDPRKNASILAQKGLAMFKEERSKNDWICRKSSIKAQIEKHKDYFRASDWERLLFIIHQIILQNNNGIHELWNFINNFDGNKKFRKGKRVFQILESLGLDEVFDKLILEEQKYKKDRKQKQSKLKSLIFTMVRKID